MLIINNYQIREQIYESQNSKVYRAISPLDNLNVILKLLKQDYPTPEELTRYKQEYQITHNLNLEGVIKTYGLETYQRTLIIILEDFGALSLKQLFCASEKRETLSLKKFLEIAIKITNVLGAIHQHNIIHKDINSSNIVLNPHTNQIKIIDFGIATKLTRENPTLKNPNILEGTLAYISPEQTGRMNCFLDYRTDFYSLGVTFYELLTGKLPFETNDPMELVHCHIAKQPPHINQHQYPQIIDNIIQKLLAKKAEARYQSAWGIQADLEQCLKQLESTDIILEFNLASQDISDKFQIPQKLYGRQEEINILLTAFERVVTTYNGEKLSENTSTELMLIAGYSGIGKTSLVKEIYKPITAKRGYFISGKFDQMNLNIPYSAVVQALSELMQHILSESEEILQEWRNKILAALGELGQIIIDVIPELELIIGKQPILAELGGNESQNRFNLVFSNFICSVCGSQKPLVIFLDDLQWCDSASLKLIELMMTDSQIEFLFLIGAYRDNEVNPSHPLMISLERLAKQGARINQINLKPLTLEHTSQLIADTLYTDNQSIELLAQLVIEKTAGNPFFVNEFLKNLYTENLINFDLQQYSWQWNIRDIQAKNLTDNVVELMLTKLKKLPTSAQKVLSFAACIGANFSLDILTLILAKSSGAIFEELIMVIGAGLILPASQLDENLLIKDYKFTHDRIQQAAYSLIDEQQKKAIHLEIGRSVSQNCSSEELSEKIFTIVDHLNLGLGLITNTEERLKIAQLNLIAGQKAKAATAYKAAFEYLDMGISLLNSKNWQTDYQLALNLYTEAAEAAYLKGDFDTMNQLVNFVNRKAINNLDKMKVYSLQILAYQIENKLLLLSIDTAIQALQILGINIPQKPSLENSLAQLAATKNVLSQYNKQQLLDLPPMKDATALAAIKILSIVVPAVHLAAPEYYPFIACNMVNLSLQYGNTDESIFGYVIYGATQNIFIEDIESSYFFGNLALKLVDKLHSKKLKSRTIFVFCYLINHWQAHLKESLSLLLEAYHNSLETGDLDYAAYGVYSYCVNRFFLGQKLSTVKKEMVIYGQAISQIKQKLTLQCHEIYHQAVLNLAGDTDNPCQLIGAIFNEEEKTPLFLANQDFVYLLRIYLNKTILNYLFQNYDIALTYAEKTVPYLELVSCQIEIAVFNFYDSLVKLAVYNQNSSSQQIQFLEQVIANQEKMQKWAGYAPMNYQHKSDLVEAETARVLGKNFSAIELYEKAIKGASNNGYLQEEALAYELAAYFYFEHNMDKIGFTYLKEAHYNYTCLLALAKVKDLESKYPQLVTKSLSTTITSTTITTSTTNTINLGQSLDLATVIKASQAIANEIVLDKLLTKLMTIIIENTGAQIGYLILETEGLLSIEAAVEDGIQSLNLPSDDLLHSNIINYVYHSQETLVLNDATNEGNFTQDSYIQTYQPKSILAAPLLNQGKLSGIVYLENNLATGAFTLDRLEIVQILSSQAAIAIDKARLYNNLEQKVTQRTQELSNTLTQLKNTQQELIQSEKMAALGQLIAGIAHEINTPLGAINSSIQYIRDFLAENLQQLPHFFRTMSQEQEQQFQSLLERSLGNNNTISGLERRRLRKTLISQLEEAEIAQPDVITNFLIDLGIKDNFQDILPILKVPESENFLKIVRQFVNLKDSTRDITTASERAGKIVFALKTYARRDHKGDKINANIIEGIETVLTLYHNLIKHGVTVIRDYQEIPNIDCYFDELNQVWTNLIHNALQAMKNQGTLTIDIKQQENDIKISISDTGIGIDAEIKEHIFKPFFTTKPPGEGSGLGLDIVKKIIEKHQGNIDFESIKGKTTFTVSLPINNQKVV